MDYERLFMDTLDDEMRKLEYRIGRRLTAREMREISKEASESVFVQSIEEFRRMYRPHIVDLRPSDFFRRRTI